MALLVVLALPLGTPAAAQGRGIEVGPFFGLFVPTSILAESSVPSVEGEPIVTSVEQRNAVALGARATGWLGDRVGIEGEFTWAASLVRTSVSPSVLATSATTSTAGSAVWLASASLVYGLPLAHYTAGLYLKAGPALVGSTGADARANAAGGVDIGGLGGVGFRFRIARGVSLRVDAEDVVSCSGVRDATTGADAGCRTQSDLVLSTGMSVALGAGK